jgi:hypothetical protein
MPKPTSIILEPSLQNGNRWLFQRPFVALLPVKTSDGYTPDEPYEVIVRPEGAQGTDGYPLLYDGKPVVPVTIIPVRGCLIRRPEFLYSGMYPNGTYYPA